MALFPLHLSAGGSAMHFSFWRRGVSRTSVSLSQILPRKARHRYTPLCVEELEQRLAPTTAGEAFVSGLYEDLLGRSPDPPGLAFWARLVAAGVPHASVVQ